MSISALIFSATLAGARPVSASPVGAKKSRAVKSAVATKTSVADTPAEQVEHVLGRYRQDAAVKAKLKKTVTQELMGSRQLSEGHFYFSKGKLRLDLETPEKSTLVYDGQNIWLENHLDESTVQVSHIRAGALKRTDSLMASLFDKKDALKGFKYVGPAVGAAAKPDATKNHQATSPHADKFASTHASESSPHVFAFEPKDKHATEIRFLEVTLRGRELERIKYKDQMENTVDFEFSEIAPAKVGAEMFSYKPPKDANVTEL